MENEKVKYPKYKIFDGEKARLGEGTIVCTKYGDVLVIKTVTEDPNGVFPKLTFYNSDKVYDSSRIAYKIKDKSAVETDTMQRVERAGYKVGSIVEHQGRHLEISKVEYDPNTYSAVATLDNEAVKISPDLKMIKIKYTDEDRVMSVLDKHFNFTSWSGVDSKSLMSDLMNVMKNSTEEDIAFPFYKEKNLCKDCGCDLDDTGKIYCDGCVD